MSEAFLVARILPFRPAPSPYPALDYLVPRPFSSEIQRGKRVRIHVKQRRMEGLVLDLFPLKESKFQNLKSLDEIFPSPALDEKQINDLEEKVEKQQTQISKQQTEIDDLKRIVNTFKPLICSQVGCNIRQSDIIGLISDDSFDSQKGT